MDTKLLIFISACKAFKLSISSIMSLRVSKQHVVVTNGSSYKLGSSPLTICCKAKCVHVNVSGITEILNPRRWCLLSAKLSHLCLCVLSIIYMYVTGLDSIYVCVHFYLVYSF